MDLNEVKANHGMFKEFKHNEIEIVFFSPSPSRGNLVDDSPRALHK